MLLGGTKSGEKIMKMFLRLTLVAMMTLFAGSAYASGVAHVFACEEGDDADEEKIEAAASKWLKAARSMKGGANLQATIYYPSAANLNTGDLLFVVTAPSHAEWGMFWDGYKDSPAEAADMASPDVVVCPSSNLFETVKVE